MAYFQAHRLLQTSKWLGELLITISNQSNYQISMKSGLAQSGELQNNQMQEDHPMGSAMSNGDNLLMDMNKVLFTDAADEIMTSRKYTP